MAGRSSNRDRIRRRAAEAAVKVVPAAKTKSAAKSEKARSTSAKPAVLSPKKPSGVATPNALKQRATPPSAAAGTVATQTSLEATGAVKGAPRERAAAKSKPTAGRSAAGKAVAKGGAMKIVWMIYDADHRTKSTFPYPQKPQADKQAAALSQSTGRPHTVKGIKVPM